MSFIEVHLYDRTNTNHIAMLDKAYDIRYGEVLSGVGSGSFAIPKASPFADVTDTTDLGILAAAGSHLLISATGGLAASSVEPAVDKTTYIAGGMIVRLRIANEDIGAFIVETIKTPDILEKRIMECSGRTLLALFNRGCLWPLNVSDYATMERTYTAKTFAYIVNDMITWARIRGVQLSGTDFSSSTDSKGTAFTDSNTIKYRAGTPIMDIILQQADLGIEATVSPSGILHYYVSGGAGQDRSSSIQFREGRNILTAGWTEDHKDLANAMLGEGQSILSYVVDDPSIATYGRRERLTAHGNIASQTYLNSIMLQSLATAKEPKQALAITVQPDQMNRTTGKTAASELPFVHYFLGDTVQVIIPSEGIDDSYRIYGIGLQASGEDLTVQLTLNSLIDVYMLQLDQAMRRSLLSPLTAITSGRTNG